MRKNHQQTREGYYLTTSHWFFE